MNNNHKDYKYLQDEETLRQFNCGKISYKNAWHEINNRHLNDVNYFTNPNFSQVYTNDLFMQNANTNGKSVSTYLAVSNGFTGSDMIDSSLQGYSGNSTTGDPSLLSLFGYQSLDDRVTESIYKGTYKDLNCNHNCNNNMNNYQNSLSNSSNNNNNPYNYSTSNNNNNYNNTKINYDLYNNYNPYEFNEY